ncbi:hypothetical protein [Peptoniphilus asaccharolyticus]
MKEDKLVFKVSKTYPAATTAIWIPTCIGNRLREIGEKTNKDIKTVASELIEFALERVEIIE